MKKSGFLLIAFVFLFGGCDMIEYHPYDGRVSGETGINEKNIALIEERCKGKETIRFAFIGDTQRSNDDTEKFVKALNARDDIDFVIHGGDVADFGLTKEFMWIRDIMNKLTVPYVVILGNHDCLANGEEVFEKVFGYPNFSFLAGNVKFVCLNTNALEFDYSLPVPDFQFIEQEMKDEREEYEKTIVAMHVHPFADQFNNNVANVFQRYIKEYRKLQFCMHAHDHYFKVNDFFEDGIFYYGTPAIARREYLIFTINEDDTHSYERVEF
ncbi:MAG: metallophosphoesterase [Prevotella sp.]|jgi:3',5'-cyclic AMP phosphodiesterase CpdA|nr:metallophosphoesterase [Prevotella sp.]